jgi:putative ATP-binding cassette transporter
MAERRHFLPDFGRLARIYWTSPQAKHGALLLVLAVGLELGTVYGNVQVSGATARIGDALQTKDAGAFFAGMGVFFGLALVFALVSAYRVYVRQVLEMRWRQGLTAHYVDRWIGPEASHQGRATGGATDNPDQRIAEDIRNFVGSALGLALSLLAAVVTLYSFAGMLWRLSNWPLQIGDRTVLIPGLMMWVAIGYALFATGMTHLVGRPLIPINFERQRVEADFRYGLVRFRDNADAVALAAGAPAERRGAVARFQSVLENWWRLIAAQRNLSLFTSGIGQANGLVPLLVAAPAFFGDYLTLGSLLQIRIAYGQVSGALSWFVYAYQEIAAWRASIERLAGFADALDTTRETLTHGGIEVVGTERDEIRLLDLSLVLPDGRALVQSANAVVARGDHVAITGPAGSGKTMLIRALAGIWPFGSGRIERPAGARTLFVSQQIYVPIGTLRDAVCYPDHGDPARDDEVRAVLRDMELAHLAADLDRVEHWEQALSGQERRRIACARLLLHRPEWLFLDDATAEVDEAVEARFYDILAERLGGATWVTTTNRAHVIERHARRWTLEPTSRGPAVLRVS